MSDRKNAHVAEHGMRVGTNVRAMREQLGLSQVELAEKVDAAGWPMSASSLLRLETGRRRIDIDDLFAIATALDVDVTDLLLRKATITTTVTWADGEVAP